MKSTSINKFEKAIELCETLDELDYVEEKIKTTSQINRHTNIGREETSRLLELLNKQVDYLIKEKGLQPF